MCQECSLLNCCGISAHDVAILQPNPALLRPCQRINSRCKTVCVYTNTTVAAIPSTPTLILHFSCAGSRAKRINIHTYIHTYMHPCRQAGRQTDRRTDRHTYIHTVALYCITVPCITLRYVTLRYLTLRYITLPNKQTNKQTNQPTNQQTNKPTNQPTNHTYIHTYIYTYIHIYIYNNSLFLHGHFPPYTESAQGGVVSIFNQLRLHSSPSTPSLPSAGGCTKL